MVHIGNLCEKAETRICKFIILKTVAYDFLQHCENDIIAHNNEISGKKRGNPYR
jgi:hypothetical protein